MFEKQSFVTPTSINFLRELQKELNTFSLQGKLKNLRIIITFLILIIIGMFVSVLLGKKFSFINPDIKAQNKYSVWEKELTERKNYN